jgi:hypothetical protein
MALEVISYNSFRRDYKNGVIDLKDGTVKLMLVGAGYTPDYDAHTKRSDITSEISGTGYSAGGQALAGKTLTKDNTNNRGVWDADDVIWASSTITAPAGVLYLSRGGASSADELIAYVDFNATLVSMGGPFEVEWHTNGIIYWAGAGMYNAALAKLADGNVIDLDTDTIHMALTLGYTFDADNHEFFSDITGEITGSGYTAGGVALTGKSVAADNTDNEGVFDADDITIDPATISADGAVFYKKRGGAASADDLIFYIAFGSTITSVAGPWSIVWAAEGIINTNG